MLKEMMDKALQPLSSGTENVNQRLKAVHDSLLKNMERISQHHTDSMKVYSELGLEQFKYVKSLREQKKLGDYVHSQVDAAKRLREQLVADAKTLLEMSEALRDDIKAAIALESAAVSAPAAPAKKPAAKGKSASEKKPAASKAAVKTAEAKPAVRKAATKPAAKGATAKVEAKPVTKRATKKAVVKAAETTVAETAPVPAENP